MSRWTPDEHGCIFDEAGCFARLTPNKADRIVTRHNTDIAAMEAERDELRRRLDTILELAPDGDLDYREIRAIAEAGAGEQG
jgi:hypothetical protein